MNKSIVPKLVSTMQQLIIDPRQQILDPWHWFIAWYDMVPLASMIVILEKKFFFPNGYKHLILGKVQIQIIKKSNDEGLMMIDRKISETLNVQQTLPTFPFQSSENVIYNTINNHSVTMSSSNFISSLKDLLEQRAMQYNVLFVPIRNGIFQEKQIYQFGNHYIYHDDNVIFCYETNQYVPISLMNLIKETIDL
ncbi:unnamed protein product [Rotaria magnacalcarata]|uniref:GCF C-terminal domain-containing protein n=1 Tax=Rotaria magnacalcarata TaxID=392030 RepID=A0A819M7Z3_9BILA|nr:unnamed protein product [Rotaria magnacalcarata]